MLPNKFYRCATSLVNWLRLLDGDAVMATKSRAKFEGVGERARKSMLQMSKTDLLDIDKMDKALRADGIKIDRRWAGRIRSKVLGNGKSPPSNGHSDMLGNVTAVLKILPSVGGIEGLEAAVALIKKIKEKV